MIKRLFLLFIVIFLLCSTIVFAISDVNCDTSDDRGNPLCVYTGITAWPPYPPYSQVKGDNNPNTQEEQDSFGTAGLYTELDGSGIEISFGGGAMDWYGESCDDPHVADNCQGVDVEHVIVDCSNEYQAFDGDPCPDGTCPFLVKRVTTVPRRLTKTRCNFLSTTPLGQYIIISSTVMDYYDAYHKTPYPNALFQRKEFFDLGCTNYKGCAGGRTCVAISDDKTGCKCIDKAGCQECLDKEIGENCDCDAECDNENCVDGVCQEACTDECDTLGTYCEGNKLVTCSLGSDDCKDKSEQTCPEGEGCWDKACRPYKMKILFLPVNWGTDETKFNEAAQAHANFFLNSLPTECSDEVGAYWKFTNCELNEDSFCGDCRGWRGDKPAADVLENLKDCANEAHYEYNYIVGLMDHHYNCPNEAGLGYSCRKKAVIVSEISDPMTSAHELGHEFGLNDEYNKFIGEEWYELWGLLNPNPLSIEYGCDPSSDCEGELCCCGIKSGIKTLPNCTKTPQYNACCLGNKNDADGRSIMSFSDIPNDYNMAPRAFEKSCLDRIKGGKGLKCT